MKVTRNETRNLKQRQMEREREKKQNKVGDKAGKSDRKGTIRLSLYDSHCTSIADFSRYEIITGRKNHVFDRAMCSTLGHAGWLGRLLCNWLSQEEAGTLCWV